MPLSVCEETIIEISSSPDKDTCVAKLPPEKEDARGTISVNYKIWPGG